MQFSELQTKVQELLEDPNAVYWTSAQIKQYINEAIEEFATTVEFPRVKRAVPMDEDVYDYDMPDNMLFPTNAYFDGERMGLKTDAQMDEAYFYGSYQETQTVFGVTTNVVSSGNAATAGWRSETGTPSVVVTDHQTQDSFRIYPIPDSNVLWDLTNDGDPTQKGYEIGLVTGTSPNIVVLHPTGFFPEFDSGGTDYAAIVSVDGTDYNAEVITYADLSTTYASLTIYKPTILTGVERPTSLVNNTDTPSMDSVWHKYLPYGACVQAYRKGGKLRNIKNQNFFETQWNLALRRAKQKEPNSYLSLRKDRSCKLRLR